MKSAPRSAAQRVDGGGHHLVARALPGGLRRERVEHTEAALSEDALGGLGDRDVDPALSSRMGLNEKVK